MKKISQILCAVAVVATMASCGKKNEFTINGAIGGNALDGEMVYLFNNVDRRTAIDSVLITEGAFTFKGIVEEPWVATVGNRGFSQTFIVEPGTISVGLDTVCGTPLNDKLLAAQAKLDISDLQPELETLAQLYYTAPNAEMRADAERQYDSVEAIANKRVLDASWDIYNDNRDNILGAFAMEQIAQMGEYSYAQFDSILAAATPVVRDYAPVAKRLQQLRAIDATSAGHHYTDIEGVDGNLSDLIDGHVALVDFYASWCGPCRAEIKDNLVPLWKKYQKQGLVIVGLNVWERGDRAAREAAHRKVMDDLGITYPQLVDSTRTATDTYGVSGIPQIMLIDKDGTILARDLRGAAIEEAITKALAK